MDRLHEKGCRKMGPGIQIVLLATILLAVFVVPSALLADSLSPAQQDALQREAIPLYPGSSLTTSDNGEELTVLWFKSSDSPKKIMLWYQQQLSSWSMIETNGMQVVYKGPPGLEANQLTGKPYIFTRSTTESEPVTSEITIRIPKQ